MFEKQRAKRIYRRLLQDLEETREIYEQCEGYDGCDRGSIVSSRRPNNKIHRYLIELSEKDGYNYSSSSFMNSLGGGYTTVDSIESKVKVLKK